MYFHKVHTGPTFFVFLIRQGAYSTNLRLPFIMVPILAVQETQKGRAMKKNVNQNNFKNNSTEVFSNGFAVFHISNHDAMLRIEYMRTDDYDPNVDDRTICFKFNDKYWSITVQICSEKYLMLQNTDTTKDKLVLTTGNGYKEEEEEILTNSIFDTDFGKWIKVACIRAIKIFFQVFASLITVDGLTTGLSDVDWLRVISVAAVSFIYNLATSLANLPEPSSSGTDSKE